MDDVAAVKRSIAYKDMSGGDPNDSVNWYKAPPKVVTDIVTILGSGAEALIGAAAALTLLSTV